MTVSMLLVLLAAGAAFDIQQLSWMAGCWEGPARNGRTEEHWMKPSGDAMFGVSRTVADGKTVFSEFMQIRRQDGEIVYTAQLGLAQKATSFKLIRGSATEAVFENPDHDFPQRILYRREPDGSLFARIEGREKGKDRAMDFPMKRVRCD